MTDTQEKYYPTKIAADLIGFDKSYLAFLIRNGQVQARTISRGTKHAYLIPESEVERLMELRELRQTGHDATLSGSAISIKTENGDISSDTEKTNKSYTSSEVCKLVGCSKWTIRYYIRKGILTPLTKPGKGRTGLVHIFSDDDVEKLKDTYSKERGLGRRKNQMHTLKTEETTPNLPEHVGDIHTESVEKAHKYDSELAMYIAKEVAKAYAEGFKEGFKTGQEAMK